MNFNHLIFLLCYFLIIACTEADLPERPNIVWITSEDNSKHYLKLFDENGVSTPNIEALAERGIVFGHAFSNAPVCSVARSALISGCFGPRTGSQFHRKMIPVSLPDSLRMFPAYLRDAGYYTANNSKEDYNFFKGADVWDESSGEASYRNRDDGQPFFYVHNLGITHESGLHFSRQQMDSLSAVTGLNTFRVQPNHPQTALFKFTNAYYQDRIQDMDRRVGELVARLKEDNLLDDTFIFYFGDHGGVLPGSKGYLYETGLHVPLAVYVPPKYQHLIDIPPGTSVEGFVSFVDFGPTVLHLAGVTTPRQMDGSPFLGPGISRDQLSRRNLAFSYADRFDEKYDLVRAVRKGNFKYLRNYQPFNFDGLMNNYRYRMLAYRQWDSLYQTGTLNQIQSAFFTAKAPEMLYNLEEDPYETKNLAMDPAFRDTLFHMREELTSWMIQMPDLSFYPEHYLIEHAFKDPVAFGQAHREDISKYIEVSSLCLAPFDQAKPQIVQSLQSPDPWERYWAIITCSIFGSEAVELQSVLADISKEDQELINRVRAAEYLGLTGSGDPVEVMTKALYASDKPAEALLILNSIVLMQSFNYNYEFAIDTESMNEVVRENDQVLRRIQFLGQVK